MVGLFVTLGAKGEFVKYFVIVITFLISFTSQSEEVQVKNNEDFSIKMPSSGSMGQISHWKAHYFVGVTKKDVGSISLGDSEMESLLNLVGIKTYIATGLAISPEVAVSKIRSSVITPWLSMFAVLARQYPDSIGSLHEKGGIVFLPESLSRGLFSSSTGWPEEILKKYSWGLEGYEPFVMPILIPAASEAPKNFEQSMKSPDGNLELFWISYFDPEKPESLLKDVHRLDEFIQEHRKEML